MLRAFERPMGAGADVNAVFGVVSTIVAAPTGVKILNWTHTMWGGAGAAVR